MRRWHRTNAREFPWRETRDPYAVLVAELMLHQTFARKVVPVYRKFLESYPTVSALAGADPQRVERLMMPLGLQRRGRRIVALAQVLVREHGGQVPGDEDGLLALPGVGPYTAGAVLAFAYERRAAIPDTNVIRLLRRFFGLGPPDARPPSSISAAMRRAALDLVPRRKPRDYNYALLDFASLVCTHYRPRCTSCPVRARCVAWATYYSSRESPGDGPGRFLGLGSTRA